VTGRDRIRAALAHREADRVPFDLGSTVVTGIVRTAYEAFRRRRGLPEGRAGFLDLKQQVVRVEEDLLGPLGVDAAAVLPRPSSRWSLRIEGREDDEVFQDELGIGYRRPAGRGLYFDMFRHPLTGAASVDDLRRHPWPDPADPARYGGLEADVDRARASGRAVVLGRMLGGIFEVSCWLRGFENFCCDLAAGSPMAGWLLDKLTEMHVEYYRRALALVGDRVDVVMTGDDVASQGSLLVSPALYRRVLKPRQARIFAEVRRSAPGAFVFHHSCGAVRPLVGDLLEAGIDALNPVQVSARGMDTAELKREFGKDLTFWGGGCDTQEVLPRGTPAGVRAEVRRRIEDLAPGGGFVFNTVHNIQADVPPENIDAMVEALADYGIYGM
jgi:uroporphyrinogen decarboxylase